jgi:D-glycero-alpha-D-manno-heptose-7-phosphate kinase
MIISKTPLRVSFAGGGTDIADYYRTGYGAVVSSAIRKYVYVTVNKRFNDDIRISHAKTEIVDSVDKIEHGLVREALRKVGIRSGIMITTIADIPSRVTGLGSSSVYFFLNNTVPNMSGTSTSGSSLSFMNSSTAFDTAMFDSGQL